MAQKSLREVVGAVKAAYNIVDYFQQSGVKLRQGGVNKWKGLCSFHNEKSPSMVIDEHFQNYHCFGCSASGDIINFVMATENLSFIEAVRKLAEAKGIELELDKNADSFDYKSLRACIREAATFYVKEFRKLDDDHAAKQEIITRGLSLDKIAYGYAPDGRNKLYTHLNEKGYSDEIILQTGVCSKFEGKSQLFDFWHGRLMFIISDITGNPIGFSGRKLFDTDKRGKYVNSSDGPLFDKSASLYHLNKAKKTAGSEKLIVVVEGQFDVASYVEADTLNVLASSGTAFTEKQAMICRRLVSEDGKIIFALDGDAAGLKAASKVFQTAPIIHSQAYVVSFPEGLDPCDYRQNNGSEALVEYTKEKSIPLIEFVLENAKQGIDFSSPIDSSKYLDKASQILKTVSSISLRDIYIKKVALDSFTSVEIIKSMVSKAEPLHSNSVVRVDADKDEEEVVNLDESDDDFDFEKIVELIEKDEIYSISARLISLSLLDFRFKKHLLKAARIMPKDLHKFVKELLTVKSDTFIIPELFTQVTFAKYMIETDFFPLSDQDEDTLEERKRMFVYLYNRLKDGIKVRGEDSIRSKIARIIQQSNTADSNFMMKALEREELEIQKLHKRLEQLN